MLFGISTGFGVLDPVLLGWLGGEAERLGFDSVWLSDHVVLPAELRSEYPYGDGDLPLDPTADLPDPIVALAFLAARTTRLLLATGCLVAPQRNAVVVAKELATLDRLSGGRVLLGVGLGWCRQEADAVGATVAWDDRDQAAEELVAACRALWTGRPVSFAGQHVRFDDVVCRPVPAAGTGIPVIVAGPSVAAARRAGRFGDGYLCAWPDPATVGQRVEAMLRAADAAGRDPALLTVTVAAPPRPRTVDQLAAVGVHRVLFRVPLRSPDRTARLLDRLATTFADQLA